VAAAAADASERRILRTAKLEWFDEESSGAEEESSSEESSVEESSADEEESSSEEESSFEESSSEEDSSVEESSVEESSEDEEESSNGEDSSVEESSVQHEESSKQEQHPKQPELAPDLSKVRVACLGICCTFNVYNCVVCAAGECRLDCMRALVSLDCRCLSWMRMASSSTPSTLVSGSTLRTGEW
jgi:hypothetical protein